MEALSILKAIIKFKYIHKIVLYKIQLLIMGVYIYLNYFITSFNICL